jgi:hypothetical protein
LKTFQRDPYGPAAELLALLFSSLSSFNSPTHEVGRVETTSVFHQGKIKSVFLQISFAKMYCFKTQLPNKSDLTKLQRFQQRNNRSTQESQISKRVRVAQIAGAGQNGPTPLPGKITGFAKSDTPKRPGQGGSIRT